MMPFRELCAFALLSAVTTSSIAASDQIIFQRSFPIQSGGAAQLDSAGLILGVDEPGSALGEGRTTSLFEDFFWTNADQGATAFVDQSIDEDFQHVTEILTNGSNDRVWIGTIWHPGDGITAGGAPESVYFFGGGSRIDFHGYEIHRIELTLDQFLIDVPGHDPNGDGNWTDLTAQANFTFYGVAVVPEPSSVALLAIAGPAMLLLAWRRRRLKTHVDHESA